jgi:hypothetical protein
LTKWLLSSTGIDVKAGAQGNFLTFFNDQTTIPIFNKRAQLFKKCFGAGDGPASAVLDNGDGTFSNAAGDLVNENGELIDDTGAVIPDNDAADREEEVAPVLDEKGQAIPDDQVILDNGDKTFEDGLGTESALQLSSRVNILADQPTPMDNSSMTRVTSSEANSTSTASRISKAAN